MPAIPHLVGEVRVKRCHLESGEAGPCLRFSEGGDVGCVPLGLHSIGAECKRDSSTIFYSFFARRNCLRGPSPNAHEWATLPN